MKDKDPKIFDSKLMQLLIDSQEKLKIKDLDLESLNIVSKVMSFNNFGYLPLMLSLNEQVVEMADFMDLDQCIEFLLQLLKVDRISHKTL